MGNVIIMPETVKDPISLIGRCAGVCWGGDITDPKKNLNRGLSCIRSNHGRTLEYPDIYAILDGYSARVIREWYTHIGGAPTRLQASTRYINYEHLDMFIPDSIHNNATAWDAFIDAKKAIQKAYGTMLEAGIPKEDAANILPLGMTTRIVDKRNVRNVMDMSRQRMCSRAYHEYRQMFNDYLKALSDYSDEWADFVELVMMPKCEALGYCPEEHSCGRMPKKDEK